MYELSTVELDLVAGGNGFAILNHVSHSFNTGGVRAGDNVKTSIDGNNNMTQVGSNGGLNVTFPLLIA